MKTRKYRVCSIIINLQDKLSTLEELKIYISYYEIDKKTNWDKIILNLSQLAILGDSSQKELADVLTSVTEQVEDLRHDHVFACDKTIYFYVSKNQKLDLGIDETVTFQVRNVDFLNLQMIIKW